ncbi:MAG: hypothetical protein ACXW3L_04305 [Limisphaerales bacterium]
MMKRWQLIATVAFFFFAILGIHLQNRAALQKERNAAETLRSQILKLANEQAITQEKLKNMDEVRSLSHNDMLELMRLRSEFTRLKTEGILATATNKAAHAETTHISNERPKPTEGVPPDSWAFSGYDSATNALQSMLWAAKRGSFTAFLECLTPQEKGEVQEQFASIPEAEASQMLQRYILPLDTLSPERMQLLSDTEASYSVYAIERNEKGVRTRESSTLKFRKVGSEWKSEGIF